MSLEIRITGITCMSEDRICMSGYDIEEKKYFRPIVLNEKLTNNFLMNDAGIISIFSLVTFEKSKESIHSPAPHIEDILITKSILNITNDLVGNNKKQFLIDIADKSIEDVFGDYIEVVNGNPVVLIGGGKRSLGTIIASSCEVFKDQHSNTRVNLVDKTGYEVKNIKCVAYNNEYSKIGKYKNIPVRISLTRQWKKSGDDEAFYWIQVSGVFPF